ncbi:radical SAM protein [bacterium]|nr:radical SAM protein [bacterium]
MISLIDSFYIHYPFCRHLCNYCDFFKHELGSAYNESEFHQLLAASKNIHSEFLKSENFEIGKLKTLYIGGGTPSLWSSSGQKYLDFDFCDSYEATMELNPGSWSEDSKKSWVDFGINRFSIGIQSTNDFYLKLLDRVHNREEVFKTLENMQGNFSVDLMLGLPYSEGKRDIISEIDELLAYNPKHFSVYILTVGKNYKHFKELAGEDFIHAEFMQVSTYLKSLGYEHYEVSNFALKGFKSQHNLKYWKSESVAALGPSATGLLRRDKSAVRYKWNGKDPRFTVENLSAKELELEAMYMGLRSEIGYRFSADFSGLIEKWNTQSYISHQSGQSIVLSSKGFLFLDSIMDDIFQQEKLHNIS